MAYAEGGPHLTVQSIISAGVRCLGLMHLNHFDACAALTHVCPSLTIVNAQDLAYTTSYNDDVSSLICRYMDILRCRYVHFVDLKFKTSPKSAKCR
jgi:hypothetical protein